jgi:hypothetical protein
MQPETYEHQFRSFQTFLDVLYGVLIGFLIARLHDFHFLGLTDGGLLAFQRVFPFVVLYLVYLLKLTLFWLGSRNSLKILCHYVPFTFRGYHYLGTILSALVITQVVSSTVCYCSAISNETILAYSIYFLAWMTIGTVLGDAIPTLAGVRPMVHKLLEAARTKASNKDREKEIEELRQHYDGPILRNGIINLAIVFLSWALYVPLWALGVDPLLRLYALVGLLVVLNVLQELHLWIARESQLRAILDKIVAER